MSTDEERCLICSTPTRKYKCSKCLQVCCSLPCYKAHQANEQCAKPQPPPSIAPDDPIRIDTAADDDAPQRLQMFTTDDTVQPDRLAQLAHSDRLKALLRNPHLRDYLRELDTTPDAWKGIKVAMLEPLFVEFANECLAVVEPDPEAGRAPVLSETEQIVSDFCAAVIRKVDGVE